MCMGCHFAVQQCNLSQIQFETGTHILGRCISCYKNKRGAEYCRLVQQHKAVCATACCECEQCHKMSTRITGSEHPQCCLKLQGLQMKCYSSRPGEMNEPYVTGYMVPYSDHNWADWFQRFTLQTGCDYTFWESNTQSRGTGVMKMKGKLFT